MPGIRRSYFEELTRRLSAEERRLLGNESRPGLPLVFLYWFLKNQALPPEPFALATLPACVVSGLCRCSPKTDLTHAYACGALNVETQAWHCGVLEKLGLPKLTWPEIVPQGAVVGEFRSGGRRLPVHAPVGDYQCSQVGAFLQENELSLNISTGSAVVQLSPTLTFGDFQTRPYFDGQWLKTITHLPAGRALNALVKLLSELALAEGFKLADPWDYALREAERVRQTDLRVDPAFYFTALGDHGALANVREENLTVGHLFRAAFTGMADNYARCAARLAPARDWSRLVFSGGLALKVRLLRDLICERLGRRHRLAAAEEDTLLGLLVLAQAFSGRAASVTDAITLTRPRFCS
jgi:sugar (pentulose or hexulose) kinase